MSENTDDSRQDAELKRHESEEALHSRLVEIAECNYSLTKQIIWHRDVDIEPDYDEFYRVFAVLAKTNLVLLEEIKTLRERLTFAGFRP